MKMKDVLVLFVMLSLLFEIIKITGTKFWGVDYLPWICLIIALILIVEEYHDKLKKVKQIEKIISWLESKFK